MRAALQPLECGISPTTRPLTPVDRRPDPPCATAKYSLPDAAVAELQDDLNKKRQLAASYVTDAKAELKGFEDTLKIIWMPWTPSR